MQEFPARKQCYDCAKGKEPSPKCPKLNLPIGVIPIGYCNVQCLPEKKLECTEAVMDWDKKDKPWRYEKDT